jgi:hypothetical protein
MRHVAGIHGRVADLLGDVRAIQKESLAVEVIV